MDLTFETQRDDMDTLPSLSRTEIIYIRNMLLRLIRKLYLKEDADISVSQLMDFAESTSFDELNDYPVPSRYWQSIRGIRDVSISPCVLLNTAGLTVVLFSTTATTVKTYLSLTIRLAILRGIWPRRPRTRFVEDGQTLSNLHTASPLTRWLLKVIHLGACQALQDYSTEKPILVVDRYLSWLLCIWMAHLITTIYSAI